MTTLDASSQPACPSSSTSLADRLRTQIHAKTLDCVHCGLCLQSCPTYRATGRETSSPRGRIYLMRGHAEGRLDDPALLAEEAFLCLGCRACETACPSGVRYGEMLETTRAAVREQQPGGRFARALERFVLREIVPRRGRLAWVVRLLALVKGLGLDRLAVRVLPEGLAQRAALMPSIPPAAERRRMPAFTPAVGERRGRVALFEGCVMPELFGRVNDAARLVLSRAGYDVVVPEAQGCCGALHAHAGDDERAQVLARVNVEVFGEGTDHGEGGGFDAVVVTSAGCSAALKELPHWIGGDGKPLASRVRDVLEFLDAEGLGIPLAPLPLRVCYDDPCHLIHAQGIAAAPRNLLNAIPQLVLVPHRNPEVCCGAAGIYNLTHPEMSAKVLSPKLDALADAGPEIVATANPGCAMQLAAGLAGRGIEARVVHPIELLEEASR
ncbi:(Fe-S)-binding protein [Myxococcota bacterium]|nr:(Fe-S)-binding protein [Myxococcota bacterium]